MQEGVDNQGKFIVCDGCNLKHYETTDLIKIIPMERFGQNVLCFTCRDKLYQSLVTQFLKGNNQ